MTRALLCCCLALLLLWNGCAPRWKWAVLHASGPPSALSGARDVAVSFDYREMRVGDYREQEWIDRKLASEADYELTWRNFKLRFENALLDRFDEEWTAGAVTRAETAASADRSRSTLDVQGRVDLIVRVQTLELGYYTPFYAPSTEMAAVMRWLSSGEETDAIALNAAVTPDLDGLSVFQHIQAIGLYMGHRAAEFLLAEQSREYQPPIGADSNP